MTAVEIILVIVAGSPAVDRELVELNARVRRLENLSELLAPSGRKQ